MTDRFAARDDTILKEKNTIRITIRIGAAIIEETRQK